MLIKKLKEKGFVFLSVKELVEINGGSNKINTSDYFFIICVLKESFRYTVDDKELEILNNHALYIGVNKTFKIADKNDNENLVIIFSSDFYQRSLFDTQLLNTKLFFNPDLLAALVSIPITDMKKYVSEKLNFHRQNNTGLETAVIHNIIEMLITDGMTHLKIFPLQELEDPPSSDIANQFMVLLQKNYKTQKQVNYYAKRLNITPKQLLRSIQKNTGKTTKEVIIDKIIQESLRLLSYSPHIISEISCELGFKNESNFSLFFKKHYGKSPSEFRQTLFAETKVSEDLFSLAL